MAPGETVGQPIDALNATSRNYTHAAGSIFAEITPTTRDAANDHSLRAPNGLHYSRLMHDKWVELEHFQFVRSE